MLAACLVPLWQIEMSGGSLVSQDLCYNIEVITDHLKHSEWMGGEQEMQEEIKNSGRQEKPGVGNTAQWAECLPGMCEAPGSIPALD